MKRKGFNVGQSWKQTERERETDEGRVGFFYILWAAMGIYTALQS